MVGFRAALGRRDPQNRWFPAGRGVWVEGVGRGVVGGAAFRGRGRPGRAAAPPRAAGGTEKDTRLTSTELSYMGVFFLVA